MPTILLLNPPSPADAIANREGAVGFGALSSGFVYPPQTLATVAAACQRGLSGRFDIRVLDCVGEQIDVARMVEIARKIGPEIVGVHASWATLDADRAAIEAMRVALPRASIVAYGAGVRYSADELLVAGASHVLLGDPELAFAALVAAPLPSPGLVKARDLLPAEHNHAGLLRDAQALPRPAWELVPWQKYGFLSLYSARGCDDSCKFCAYVTAQGKSFRPRPADDVVAEMTWLANTFRPRRILVRDPVFAADRTRAMAIARGLKAVEFSTRWECESRPEHFDANLLKALAAAGCKVIKIGVETADPDLLARIGRVQTPEDGLHYLAYTRHVIAEARAQGMVVRASVMVGLPGQTRSHIEATAVYLRQARPTFVHVRPYEAYPRVPLGPGQTPAQIEFLAGPLQGVAAECEATAQRPGLWPRLLQRIRRR